MKSVKLVVGLVAVIVVAAAGLYVAKIGPMDAKVIHHELKIGELERRATSAEQKLEEHDKRIAILESTVQTQGVSIAKTQADLVETRSELRAAEQKLQQVEDKQLAGDAERARLATEVEFLRKKIEKLESDLVKRIEVLEKLNEGKLQR